FYVNFYYTYIIPFEIVAEYRYETAYACEGKILKIECKAGELIKLIRANYGRFSITICNDHGHTDWSVDCMSPKSRMVLQSRCTDKQNCTIDVNNDTFGDPCPGTSKYIEAHYVCSHEVKGDDDDDHQQAEPAVADHVAATNVEHNKAAHSAATSPDAVLEDHASAAGTSSGPSPTTTTRSPSTANNHFSATPPPQPAYDDADDDVYPEEITTLPFTTVTPKAGEPPRVTTPDGMMQPYTNEPSILTAGEIDPDNMPYQCSPITVRSIYWNWTKANTTAIQPCPGVPQASQNGTASRCPARHPTWYPSNPDLSECRSVWLTSLEQRINAGRDPLVSITNDLAQVTSSKTLYGGDMMITDEDHTEDGGEDEQGHPNVPRHQAEGRR
ncbi:hypothetical protein NQ318_015815, partial [Aromia moschata]